MITATISSGYIPILSIAYPIEITNNGAEDESVTIAANNTNFTAESITILVGEVKIIYAATSSATDTVIISGSNVISLDIVTQEVNSFNFGEESYIAVFELPGGVNDVIPTLENIGLLMRQGHYFKEAGNVKVWRPDTL